MSAKWLQCVWLCATLWTVAWQVPLSMGFSRQEYWSRLRFPFQGIFLTQGSNPRPLPLLHWQAGSLPAEPVPGFWKGPESKYLRLFRLCCHSAKVGKWINVAPVIQIKLHSWTLTLKFHVILKCQKVVFSSWFFKKHFKTWKRFLAPNPASRLKFVDP